MSQPQRRTREKREIAPVCLSPTEFAQATGISRPVLYRWMRDGKLRFVQASSKMRKIPTTELARLLAGATD